MSKVPKLVEVIWVDSCYHSGWKTKREKVEASTCRTIGYQVRSSKKKIAVAMSVSENGNCSETMAIPRSAVKSIKRLR